MLRFRFILVACAMLSLVPIVSSAPAHATSCDNGTGDVQSVTRDPSSTSVGTPVNNGGGLRGYTMIRGELRIEVYTSSGSCTVSSGAVASKIYFNDANSGGAANWNSHDPMIPGQTLTDHTWYEVGYWWQVMPNDGSTTNPIQFSPRININATEHYATAGEFDLYWASGNNTYDVGPTPSSNGNCAVSGGEQADIDSVYDQNTHITYVPPFTTPPPLTAGDVLKGHTQACANDTSHTYYVGEMFKVPTGSTHDEPWQTLSEEQLTNTEPTGTSYTVEWYQHVPHDAGTYQFCPRVSTTPGNRPNDGIDVEGGCFSFTVA